MTLNPTNIQPLRIGIELMDLAEDNRPQTTVPTHRIDLLPNLELSTQVGPPT